MQPDDIGSQIQLCRLGKPQAYDWLIDTYGHRLYAYFARRSRNAADAEDLLQELMMKVVANIANYNHTGRFDAWLFTLAANLVRDRGRRQNRHPQPLNLCENTTYAPAPTPDPLAHAQNHELGDRLQNALDTLPELDRDVILLRYYGGLSFKELAERFQMPLGTALAKVHRGLKTLRKKLETKS